MLEGYRRGGERRAREEGDLREAVAISELANGCKAVAKAAHPLIRLDQQQRRCSQNVRHQRRLSRQRQSVGLTKEGLPIALFAPAPEGHTKHRHPDSKAVDQPPQRPAPSPHPGGQGEPMGTPRRSVY